MIFKMTRKTPPEAISLIQEFEGLKLIAYKCPGGIWTIGYGHTGTAHPGMEITEEEAEALLRGDLLSAERAVSRLVKVRLTDGQFGVLVSFTFNVGIGNFQKSTLLKLLNRGWYEQVPAQLMRWNKSNGEVLGGLSRRRRAEGQLWKRSST